MAEPSIKELAEEWLRLDKSSTTRDEIYKLLMHNDFDELEKRLRHRIAFGTAGLRGPMQAGFACVNPLTIIQASQGLAAYLLETEENVQHRGVVIGHDARHHSEHFAKLTAAAFVEKGIRVWWYEADVHTPLVPFGVRELGAVAGVMITASHNPARDNGYKVYWSNGCQIIPPHDSGIAAAILRNLEPVTWDTEMVEDHLLVEGALGLVQDAYFRALTISAQPETIPTPDYSAIKFVYTPLHGVGLAPMRRALKELHLEHNMIVVPEQADPDPNFSTVQFPNPEEKGALDLAIQTANAHPGISLILASDPDADRLAVAQKLDDGRWHQFTGNQLGVLLASFLLDTADPAIPRSKTAMLTSAVSSRMLSHMARLEGFHFVETLTGFKWLGNVARELKKPRPDHPDEEFGYRVLFAYEEALGYMIPTVAHDKDAISTAAVFLTAVATWRRSPSPLTLYDKLQQLYQRYGYFADRNTYLLSPSPAATAHVFAAIRARAQSPEHPYPPALGAVPITRWRDLTRGYDSATPDHVPALPVDAASQMITAELADGVVFTVRASGTEPKVKIYIEARSEVSEEEAARLAQRDLDLLLTEWFAGGGLQRRV